VPPTPDVCPGLTRGALSSVYRKLQQGVSLFADNRAIPRADEYGDPVPRYFLVVPNRFTG